MLALKTGRRRATPRRTLLSAMEGAGKLIEDDELRAAMHDKGLGTPATRAAIIEGLIYEKYMHRDGRELVPTAKAFQLMTLLRGLDVEDLTKPELTGDWEYQPRRDRATGRLSRDDFMKDDRRDGRAHRAKAKEYDRDTIPGDYATLAHAVPQVRRRGRGELPALRVRLVRVQHHQDPGRAQLRDRRGSKRFCATRRSARSRAFAPRRAGRSRPSCAWCTTTRSRTGSSSSTSAKRRAGHRRTASRWTSAARPRWAPAPKCKGHVYEHGTSYVCEHAVARSMTCDFKSGKIILQQPVAHEQMHKLLGRRPHRFAR